MSESFLGDRVRLHHGDCLDVLDTMEPESLDACVCDPPYDLGFMGKAWDRGGVAFEASTWTKVLRVLKPGAHLVAFAAPKNVGFLQVAIAGAGFEMRDCILQLLDLDPLVLAFMRSLNDEQRAAFVRVLDDSTFGGMLAWIFGQGFPKSMNIARAIDTHFGKDGTFGEPRSENHAAWLKRGSMRGDNGNAGWQSPWMQDAEALDRNAREYIPATDEAKEWNGWGLALKPAFEPIIIARKPFKGTVAENVLQHRTGAFNIDACLIEAEGSDGRWPANVITDGSAAATSGFPDTGAGGYPAQRGSGGIGNNGHRGQDGLVQSATDEGSAARYFYTAKADDDDRLGSAHPTIKPVDAVQWLCRLVCRKGGTVLDIFAGTGTTGEAAYREGMNAVLIEREPEYCDEIRRRMGLVLGGPSARSVATAKEKAKRKPIALGPLFDQP